jgi:hypothetical protein
MKAPRCEEKKTYADLPTARKNSAMFWTHTGRRLWPYRCDTCGDWHLTSQTPDEQLKNGYNTTLK